MQKPIEADIWQVRGFEKKVTSDFKMNINFYSTLQNVCTVFTCKLGKNTYNKNVAWSFVFLNILLQIYLALSYILCVETINGFDLILKQGPFQQNGEVRLQLRHLLYMNLRGWWQW